MNVVKGRAIESTEFIVLLERRDEMFCKKTLGAIRLASVHSSENDPMNSTAIFPCYIDLLQAKLFQHPVEIRRSEA